AEYARSLNRNAATDAADIVVYNPAGLVDLSKGYHLNISNQTWVRRPSHSFDDPLGGGRLRFEQKKTDWIVPNVHAAYCGPGWALFAAAYIPAGGAAVDYPDGSYSTRLLGAGIIGPGGPYELIYNDIDDEYLEGTSLYLALSAGAACRVTEGVSLAAGIRTVSIRNEIRGGLTLTGGLLGPMTQDVPLRVRVSEEGRGWGVVCGIQVRPSDAVNLALHYESPTRIDVRADVKSGDNVSQEAGLFSDGAESPRDLPAMVGLGASFRVGDRTRVELDANYWFQKDADWGRSADGRGLADLAGDSYSVGASVCHALNRDLEVSCGFLYTWYDFEDMDGFYRNTTGAVEVYYENDLMIGLGFAYRVTPSITFNLGTGVITYRDAAISTGAGTVSVENDLSGALALGVDCSF
ncbi:MAG TPA: hypothetical protein PLT69_10170, partial [Deltaproteobacteria bacterium]|nr:hypothetical protein [Deltaproteobacteria bacterium]